MQKYIIIVFVTILSNTVYAQSNRSNIISITPTKNLSGLYFGFSNIEHNAVINGSTFTSNNPTLSMGMLFEKELSEKFKLSIRPGILIAHDIRNDLKIDNKLYKYNYSNAIIELPLIMVYYFKPNKQFNGIPNYLHFGPVFSYNFANATSMFNVSESYMPSYTKTIRSFSKENVTNLKFGFGYDIKLKFVNFRPEFAYNLGFNSLKTNTIPNLNFSKIRNNLYSIQIIVSQRMNKVIYKKVDRTGPPLWKKIFGSFKGK